MKATDTKAMGKAYKHPGKALNGDFYLEQNASNGVLWYPRSKRNGVTVMKTLVSMVALILALAVTGPAFAGDVTKATDKASCDKAGGTWDDTAKKCSEKKM